jgi:predicted TIM-barrel fold metal-dependent hydrolase
MDSMGIWAQVVYPNVGGFGNQAFLDMDDHELRLACVQAYNDWLIEWCSADARRLIPIMATPFWDVDESVKEIERCAGTGHRGILFTGEPQRFGMPYFADRYWDPLWSAAQAVGLPISFHLGSGDIESHFNPDVIGVYGFSGASTRASVALYLGNAIQVGDFMVSGVLPRFPGLKIVSVESGAGWVPFLLETMDRQFTEYETWKDLPQFTEPPSHYFKDQVFLCHFYEDLNTTLLDLIGENVMFETDFPHPNGLHTPEVVWDTVERTLAQCSAAIRHKVTFSTAAELYSVAAP